MPFTYKDGDTQPTFSGAAKDTVLQTGTTAGTIRVIAELGSFTDQATATVLPTLVTLDTKQGTVLGNGVQIDVSGYDNSRSAGPLRFTFYDRNGNPLSVGAIRVDVGVDFRRYFDTTTYGGMFTLRAFFPVNSGSPAEISAVDLEITNNAGTTAAVRIPF